MAAGELRTLRGFRIQTTQSQSGKPGLILELIPAAAPKPGQTELEPDEANSVHFVLEEKNVLLLQQELTRSLQVARKKVVPRSRS